MQQLITIRDTILHCIGFICAMGFLIGIPTGFIYLCVNSPPMSTTTCVYPSAHSSTPVCGKEASKW